MTSSMSNRDPSRRAATNPARDLQASDIRGVMSTGPVGNLMQ
jgi:hypothetical protein